MLRRSKSRPNFDFHQKLNSAMEKNKSIVSSAQVILRKDFVKSLQRIRPRSSTFDQPPISILAHFIVTFDTLETSLSIYSPRDSCTPSCDIFHEEKCPEGLVSTNKKFNQKDDDDLDFFFADSSSGPLAFILGDVAPMKYWPIYSHLANLHRSIKRWIIDAQGKD